MSNKFIEETIKEANNNLNSVEDMGEAAVNIADRLIESCKGFLHPPNLKDFEDKIAEVNDDVIDNINDAKQKISDQYGKDSYMYHQILANHIINTRIEKTNKLINYLDQLNRKL